MAGCVLLLKIVLTINNYTLVPDSILAFQKETKSLPQQTIKRDEFTTRKRKQ